MKWSVNVLLLPTLSISHDMRYVHPLMSVSFVFADFNPLLCVPSLHPCAVAEPRLY